MEDGQHQDICRVCRSEGSPDRPLFHPCICTGSIKFIHQECLLQWLKYSKKEHCELCKHRFVFTPIYSPDMPTRLPIMDIMTGLIKSIARAIRYWFHYTLVAVAWLGVVPLTACRIYRCLFTGSVNSLLTLPLDMLSTENLLTDCFQGCFVVTCTLCAFISLVWLREQILHGGGPDWLDIENPFGAHRQNANNGAQNNVGGVAPADGAVDNAAGNQGNEGGANQDADNQAAQAEEAAEAEAEEDGGNGGQNAAQEENWNPIEWDRAAEELTWERLLGLDGSLVFLEHVFWVVSLNTLFILVFAFCPYHIGHFTIIGFKAEDMFSASQFEGLLTTLLGYLLISVSLVVLHTMVSVARLKRSKRILGLCYVVVKVSLLVVVEIGLFPLVCGWWLDICSLSMFDATLKDRQNSFKLAPGTSMFIHWLVGMVYVFYFASFILLLREVLRPGVLWFLRNLNDPDFNPIQEMIHLPIYRHVRRFLASMVIFGSTVLIMLWMPVRIVRFLFPKFLPYNVMLSSDSPVSELSLELLLLQVVLPALLEQGHTRQWLKNLVRGWCVVMAWMLNLRSYLLGDVPLEPEQRVHNGNALADMSDDEPEEAEPEAAGEADNPLAAAVVGAAPAAAAVVADPLPLPDQHVPQPQDVLEPEAAPVPVAPQPQGEAPEEPPAPAEAPAAPDAPDAPQAPGAPEPQPAGVPAPPQPQQQGLGAAHQAMLQGGGPAGFQPYKRPNMFHARLILLCVIMCVTLFFASLFSCTVPVYVGRRLMSTWMGEAKLHELYTAACGLYTCWLTMRAITIIYNWVPQGWTAIFSKVQEWVILIVKAVVLASMLLGVVPLLLGLLFELVVVAPLRVPLDQSPVFFPWQDWALGVLHAKIICAVTMMGPNWWLRRVIEQVYNQGLRNLDLLFILTQLCLPVIGILGMILALPYIFARSIIPAVGCTFEMQNLVLRRIYPFLLTITLLSVFCVFQAQQFKRLYEHIKNDKYLVGQRLVNYDRRIRPRVLS